MASKNIVFIPAIENAHTADGHDNMAYKEFALNTWKWWCDKNNVDLFLMSESMTDPNEMSATWQRYWMYDILEHNKIDYDQVLMVDVDTMVRWDAPNFFELNNRELSLVRETWPIEWLYNSVEGYRHMFPDVKFEWPDYVSSGFILSNEKHKELYKSMVDFYLENKEHLLELQYKTLRKGSDITPLNYMIRKLNIKLNKFPNNYHLTSMGRHNILDGSFIKIGYVWHFNGFEKEQRFDIMKKTWELIQENYK